MRRTKDEGQGKDEVWNRSRSEGSETEDETHPPRNMLQSFRDLDFYQDAYQLALELHPFTLRLPACEQRGGLASQIQRASKRIPAVIAEGWGRREHRKEFQQFLAIAIGSGEELQVHLDFCRDLGYLEAEQHAVWHARYRSVIRRMSAFRRRWE